MARVSSLSADSSVNLKLFGVCRPVLMGVRTRAGIGIDMSGRLTDRLVHNINDATYESNTT